jgi:hypothetical protein
LKSLTDAAKSGDKLNVGIDYLSDLPVKLDVTSEILGKSAGNIVIGTHSMDEIANDSMVFSEVLPCDYIPDESISASTEEALQSIFKRDNFFNSFTRKARDSNTIDNCFRALTRMNDKLGAMFVKSVGVDRILRVMEELPGVADQIASDLYRVSPSSLDALRSQTILTSDVDDKKDQERLETVLGMSPVLADKVLSGANDQVLLEIIAKGSFDDAVKSLSALRKVNLARYESLIKVVDDRTFLTKLISHGPALPTVDFLNIDPQVRATLIKSALEKVDADFLKQRLRGAYYWPTEFLVEIVKNNQDTFLNIMDGGVIDLFYKFPAPSALVPYSDGAHAQEVVSG